MTLHEEWMILSVRDASRTSYANTATPVISGHVRLGKASRAVINAAIFPARLSMISQLLSGRR